MYRVKLPIIWCDDIEDRQVASNAFQILEKYKKKNEPKLFLIETVIKQNSRNEEIHCQLHRVSISSLWT